MNVNMTVLDRQRALSKFQQQEEQQPEREQDLFGYYSNLAELCVSGGGGLLSEVVNQSVKLDPDPFEVGWPNLVDCCFENESKFNYDDFNSSANNICTGKASEMINHHHGVSNTSSCPQEAGLVPAGASEKMVSCGAGIMIGRESFRKRKADKVGAQNESRDKRSKGCGEEAKSKITLKSSSNNNQNKENSGDASKENVSKITEVQKPDYIHVRARRGQATDSHSLAERLRRDKISKRMRYLQDLVPGCNKVIGKAGMLDEIINYVQSLQRQVEFLTMKLAAVNPKLDCNFDSLFSKEAFPACSTAFPSIGMSTDMASSSYLQFNPLQQQIVNSSGLDTGLKRIISTPLSVPETFISSPCFNIQPTSVWNADPQNLDKFTM